MTEFVHENVDLQVYDSQSHNGIVLFHCNIKLNYGWGIFQKFYSANFFFYNMNISKQPDLPWKLNLHVSGLCNLFFIFKTTQTNMKYYVNSLFIMSPYSPEF